LSARVVIAGGGVAALEAAIALHETAADRAEVGLYSPRQDFIYRPFAVAEPYGTSRPMRYDLSELAARCGATYHRATIGSVDGDSRRVHTHDGEEVAYDYLIVASGTRLIAGVSGAVTFWGVPDDPRVQDVIRDLREARVHRLAFTMPGGGTWALPLYELALLADAELSKREVKGGSLVIVTPEDSPLEVFGRAASERAGELLAEREVEVVTEAMPIQFHDGQLAVSPHGTVDADAVLSLPRMEGRRIAGVPHDDDGFVPVDEYGRVHGMEHAYAAGDVTTFPVKQGGVATQQADVVAEAIAARLGCDVVAKPLDPILRGVLWTGAEPLYLSGYLAGGHGETSYAGEVAPWEGGEQDKLVARYLTPFLAGLSTAA